MEPFEAGTFCAATGTLDAPRDGYAVHRTSHGGFPANRRSHAITERKRLAGRMDAKNRNR